jgi:hypothetical protein
LTAKIRKLTTDYAEFSEINEKMKNFCPETWEYAAKALPLHID